MKPKPKSKSTRSKKITQKRIESELRAIGPASILMRISTPMLYNLLREKFTWTRNPAAYRAIRTVKGRILHAAGLTGLGWQRECRQAAVATDRAARFSRAFPLSRPVRIEVLNNGQEWWIRLGGSEHYNCTGRTFTKALNAFIQRLLDYPLP